MNRLLPWAILVLLAAAAWFVLPKVLDRRGTPPPIARVTPPAPKAPPFHLQVPLDFRLYRSRDEVIVFARTTEFGLPASDAVVVLSDAAGKEVKQGRTDGTGVFRGRLPDGAATVTLRASGAEVWRQLPPAPPPPPPPEPPILADRSVLRPGDGLKVAYRVARQEDAVPPSILLVGRDGSSEQLAFPVGPSAADVRLPCWDTIEGRIPDDASPGIARIEYKDQTVLEIPLVPRFGSAAVEEDGPGGDPDQPPLSREPGLAFVDGEWRIRLPGREEGAAVLFFCTADDRFLTHAAIVPPSEEARAALAASSGSGMRVRAVAASAAGFQEWEATPPPTVNGPFLEVRWGPMNAIPPSLVARVRPAPSSSEDAPGPLAALALAADDPTGRIPWTVLGTEEEASELWLGVRNGIHSVMHGFPLRIRALATGGALSGTLWTDQGPPPEDNYEVFNPVWLRPGDLVVGGGDGIADPLLEHARVLLAPGAPGGFPGRDRSVLPDTEVRWRILGQDSLSGGFRLRAGPAIVLEGRPGGAANGGGSSGTVGGALISGLPLALETMDPGLEGLLLEAAVSPAPFTAPATGDRIAIERSMPSHVLRGDIVEAAAVLRAEAACGPVVVTLPLPSGGVPVEDGWEVRRRSPPGTRVGMPPPPGAEGENRVVWVIPELSAGRTRLSVRVRLDHRGDLVSPAARAESQDPSGPWARSAAGRIVVE